MKKLAACIVTAAMLVSAIPAGVLPVRAEQAVGNESSGEDVKSDYINNTDGFQPVGDLEKTEAIYISGDDEIIEPEVKTAGKLYYSGLDSFWAECASTNGRSALPKEAQKTFYDQIDEAATAFMESTTDVQASKLTSSDTMYYPVQKIVEGGDKSLSSTELLQAYKAYDYDHPAYYWIDNRMVFSDDYLYLITDDDYALASVRTPINEAIISGVNAYKARADYAEDTLDKIAIIHDAIIEEINYAYRTVEGGRIAETAKWAHSVHGVFSSHKSAVCEGYSDTFAMMMNYMGIPNYYVVGNAIDEKGNSGGHAWNMVSADGSKYMYMDLTWDDLTEKGLYDMYFGMPASDFVKRHVAYTSSGSNWLYALPTNVGDSFADTYYAQAGYYFDGTDADTAAKRMRTKAQRFGNGFSFLTKSTGDIDSILKKWGQTGSYSYYNANYKGTDYYIYVKTFTDKTDITGATVTLPESSYECVGSAVTPEPVVTCNGIRLIKGLNYTTSYTGNTSAGTGTVTVTGTGNYTGSSSAQFTVTETQATEKSVEDILVKLAKDTFEYTGAVIKPQVTVKDGDEVLEEGVHYTVTLEDSVNAGDYQAVVTGKGAYTGSVSLAYSITPQSISAQWVHVTSESYTYDGTEKKPSVTVNNGSKDLAADTDYTVTYQDNIAAGSNTARVIVEGTGNYTAKVTKSFTIDKASLADAQMTLSQTSYEYDGTAKTPTAVLTMGSMTLVAGTDYTLSYNDNTEATDSATVTATGKGNYSGTKTITFSIVQGEEPVEEAVVTITGDSFTYSGQVQKPVVTVTVGTKKLTEGTDYSVTYSGASVNAGEYEVTVAGLSGYSFSKKQSYTIAPKEIVISGIKAEDKIYDGTTVATLDYSDVVITGLVTGESLSVSASGAFADAEQGANKTVKISGITISGTAAGNYRLATAGQQTTATASISAAKLTVDTLPTAGSVTYGSSLSDSKLTGGVVKNDGTMVVGTFAWKTPTTRPTVADSEKTEYDVVFTPASGDYETVSCKVKLTVLAKKLGKDSMTLSETKPGYDGKEKKPVVTVKDGTTVVPASEYTVSYKDNVEIGNATVTVTDNTGGNYEVSGVLTFEIVDEHEHELMLRKEVKATCTEDGKKAYYECEGCGKLYEDAEGEKEVTEESLIIKAEGHKLSLVPEVKATCTEDGKKAYYECEGCGKLFEDAEGEKEVTEESLIIKAEGHKLSLVPEVKATCTEDGKKAYYECEGCGKLFEDAEGEKEVTEESLIIKAEEHSLLHIEEEPATYDMDGHIEYWVCEKCLKYFADPEGKAEITGEETVVKKHERKDISGCSVSGLGTKAWTGSAVKPAITVKLDGETLKAGTDYKAEYKNNVNAGKAEVIITGMGDYEGAVTKSFIIKKPVLKYRAYVQKKGWMIPWTTAKITAKTNEKTFAGTTDNLRMETIQMQLSGIGGSVKYRAYVEKMGWTQWATTADKSTYAGTKGMARRVEMIQLQASGQVANLYDMYYRTYCEKFGWLGWAENKAKSGSAGYARKLEAFQVQFVPKGTSFDKGRNKAFYDKTKDGDQ